MERKNYENPLWDRYASEEMRRIFSPDEKFSTWRELWCVLAESEMELGLPITPEQVEQLRSHIHDIDYAAAGNYERLLRHDVMAHIRAFGDVCPDAKPIIHLGATSCYVGDNTDIILMRRGLMQIRRLLINAVAALAELAEKHADTPVLAYTHFQAAQPTTVGKRICLWMQDLLSDLRRLDCELDGLRLLGCKGATGTCAGFLELFDGDMSKIRRLEEKIAEKLGFEGCIPISGQTYPRKVDAFIMNVLSGIAQSCGKMATDLRLMAHMKEFDEPAEPGQVGSSAMAYKRNPMRCERICSLSRFVINSARSAPDTAMNQWLERSLDDSANRRISIPETFLAADGILSLVINVASGCRLYPLVMEKHLREELPFIASENILMDAVLRGGDRQELHEAIRLHSIAAAERVKLEGGDNDLLERLLKDERFGLSRERLETILDVRRFVGCAPEQTRAFLQSEIRPLLEGYRAVLGAHVDIRV